MHTEELFGGSQFLALMSMSQSIYSESAEGIIPRKAPREVIS
jgi:hypothetical protein